MKKTNRPIKSISTRAAIRRKVTGIRITADVFGCRQIDANCNLFFRSRGLPVYGAFGTPTT